MKNFIKIASVCSVNNAAPRNSAKEYYPDGGVNISGGMDISLETFSQTAEEIGMGITQTMMW